MVECMKLELPAKSDQVRSRFEPIWTHTALGSLKIVILTWLLGHLLLPYPRACQVIVCQDNKYETESEKNNLVLKSGFEKGAVFEEAA
jgi:hypothetical protein